mmetsp:Transcript_106557/g.227574  ORF Transcript_106557/g.227574 Transcript_106557/m.227574 type:complete len:282 (-) Transcript_106557:51-896(-)
MAADAASSSGIEGEPRGRSLEHLAVARHWLPETSGKCWTVCHFRFPNWGADIEPAIRSLMIGGVAFEEVRIDRNLGQWDELKASGLCPYEQLPLLTFSQLEDPEKKMVLAQSNAINRVCGKRAGLMDASEPVRYAKIDEILCAVQDLKQKFVASILQKDVELKAKMRQLLIQDFVRPWLRHVEAVLSKNAAHFGAGFCVGPALSIADIALDCVLSWFESGAMIGLDKETVKMSEFPLICAARAKARDEPAIQARRESMAYHKETEWVLQQTFRSSVSQGFD